MPLELNCGYHPCVSFEKDTDPRSQSKLADKLSAKLQDQMTVCQKKLHHAHKLQKRAHNKRVKHKSYTPGDKVWLNSKYIKTKRNQKLEAKFFGRFRVLHSMEKQAYKVELAKRWKMHNLFYVLLLEQDTTRKERVDERVTKLELQAGNSEEYKVEAIWDSAVYASELESGQLPGLYYLVVCKDYSKEENTWKPLLTAQHLEKLISCFHKEYVEKSTATSLPINSALPLARPTMRPTPLKRKQSQPPDDVSKQANNWFFWCSWHLINSLVIPANNKWSWLKWNHLLLISHHLKSTIKTFFVKLPLIASVFLFNLSY